MYPSLSDHRIALDWHWAGKLVFFLHRWFLRLGFTAQGIELYDRSIFDTWIGLSFFLSALRVEDLLGIGQGCRGAMQWNEIILFHFTYSMFWCYVNFQTLWVWWDENLVLFFSGVKYAEVWRMPRGSGMFLAWIACAWHVLSRGTFTTSLSWNSSLENHNVHYQKRSLLSYSARFDIAGLQVWSRVELVFRHECLKPLEDFAIL